MRKVLGSALVLVALTAGAAQAQSPITWHAGIGLNLPQSDLGTGANTGFGLIAGGDYALRGSPIAIRGDLGWNHWGLDGISESVSDLSITAAALYPFKTKGAAKPYVDAGLGWYRFSSSVNGSPSNSDIGFNFGGGVNFMMGKTKMFADGRYHVVSHDGGGEDNIALMVGLRF